MSSTWRRILAKHAGKTLIEFNRRPKIDERIAGFISDHSKSFIMVQRLNWDAFVLNGYSIIRNKDIKSYRVFSNITYWQTKAVKKFKLRPKLIKNISLRNWPEIVFGVLQHFPLVTIHYEIEAPDVCYIGVPLRVTAKTLILDNLDCNAEWSGIRRIKLDDITRIDFDGGYEVALAATAQRRTRKSTASKIKMRRS